MKRHATAQQQHALAAQRRQCGAHAVVRLCVHVPECVRGNCMVQCGGCSRTSSSSSQASDIDK